MLTVGAIVHLKLNAAQAGEINRGRDEGRFTCNGAQPGDILPMMVVKPWSDDCVNGQVFLDGDGSIWGTSVERGEEEGQWSLPRDFAGSV